MSDDHTTPRQVSPERPVPEDAVTDRDTADETLTIEPQPPAATWSPADVPTAGPAASYSGLVTVRTGPRPGAIMLGLLCLLVAGYTMARQLTEWRLDIATAGPVTIGALGVVLLLAGLAGLLGRRRP